MKSFNTKHGESIAEEPTEVSVEVEDSRDPLGIGEVEAENQDLETEVATEMDPPEAETALAPPVSSETSEAAVASHVSHVALPN